MVNVTVKDIDKGYKRIVLNIKEFKGHEVKIGVMGNETNEGTAIVDYAIYNEFGTSRIPARPFMATTSDRYRDAVIKFAEHLVGSILDGKLNVRRALANLGEFYQAKMQQTIREAKEWAEPNAPSTIKAKGSSSPLIDTGRLVQSIRYEVK